MRVVRLPLRVFVLIVMLLLCACSSTVATTPQLRTEHTNDGSAVTPTVLATAAHPVSTLANPIRLVIPAVGINASVEMVGIRADGILATPTRSPWDDVGWYDLGPHPGERGSAVIDGHLDRPGGYPAVFWRLRDIQVGNDVQVTNSAGKTLHFQVTRIAYYPADQAPLQDIFGNLGGTYLNLITCAGDWIPNQHQTTLRLVVYTISV
jgi:hypothetical protein